MPSPVRVLYNPASGRGRGARVIGAIREAFAAHGFTDVRATAAPGDEARLVREALDDGVGTLVVAGGDGTWGKCAVPLARAGSPARMAFLAAGTGNDFAKNLGLPARDPAALARAIADGAPERRVDLGRVDDTWFLNVAGFGFDVAVLRASLGARLWRGPALYVATAVRELFAYGGLDACVTTGGGDPPADASAWRRHLLLVFSNGAHFGGAFRIAPDARVDDGALDAVLVGDTARWRRLPLLARAMRGTHLADARVRHARAGGFRVAFRAAPWFEADGELHRATGEEVEVASVPAALRVVDLPAVRATPPA